MAIYRRCGRCGKRILSGTKCSCLKERHKEYDRKYRDRVSNEFYHSREWSQARDYVLTLDGGIDVYLYMTTGEILIADTVHHIEPLKDNWSKRVEVSNLMSLHHDTHSWIEKQYDTGKEEMIGKLSGLIRKYRERIEVGGIEKV